MITTFLILLFVTFGYLTGYRLTGLQAAKAHFSVSKTPQYIDQVNYKWGTVYLFNTKEGPRTIISERRFVFWVARIGFHMKTNADNISIIGWGNNENCTVYCVKVSDQNVNYIEMGKGEHRIRRYKNEKNQILFSWDIQIPWNDFNGIAYSSDGKELYKFRYPKDTNHLRHEDLRWYAIDK